MSFAEWWNENKEQIKELYRNAFLSNTVDNENGIPVEPKTNPRLTDYVQTIVPSGSNAGWSAFPVSPYYTYIGTEYRSRFLRTNVMNVVQFCYRLIWNKYQTVRPVILDGSSFSIWSPPSHPLFAHSNGRAWDQRYVTVDNSFYTEWHVDFWELLFTFFPELFIFTGEETKKICERWIGRDLPYLHVSDKWNHKVDLENPVSHMHMEPGREMSINWKAEIPNEWVPYID